MVPDQVTTGVNGVAKGEGYLDLPLARYDDWVLTRWTPGPEEAEGLRSGGSVLVGIRNAGLVLPMFVLASNGPGPIDVDQLQVVAEAMDPRRYGGGRMEVPNDDPDEVIAVSLKRYQWAALTKILINYAQASLEAAKAAESRDTATHAALSLETAHKLASYIVSRLK